MCVYRYIFATWLLLICLWSASVWANTSVLSVTYKQEVANEYLVIYSNQPLVHQQVFALENPSRLVLDVARVGNHDLTIPVPPKGTIARSIRFGHFTPETSRFVVELADTITSYDVHQFAAAKGQPHRLVLRMKPGKRFTERAVVSQQEAENAGFIPTPVDKPFFSPAQQHKPLVVIDAGHGGKDPGAIGRDKTLEKDVTLRYALALRRALLRTGQYNVAMTRSDDRFIFLHERVRMARNAGGDLFISLHADSAPQRSARGISVYTVSEKASDKEAATLAKKENEADRIGGIKFAEDHPEVADILIDLASRDARIKATDFSQALVKQFRTVGLKLLKNPNRYAGFRVLKAPDIPSVLVEMGFLSNRVDEGELKTRRYRDTLIQAMVRGVDDYFTAHPVER